MSGHSKWSTIKRKKGAADAKRGAIFTRHSKEITLAAREGGGDIDMNPTLRLAVKKAKSDNMPAANIDRAIKKGTGDLAGVKYENYVYEGYGPGGVAIMMEIMTDNKNRTVPDIRHIMTKNGGNLGESGCVSWIFTKKGKFEILAKSIEEDLLIDLSLDLGADDVVNEGDSFLVLTEVDKFEDVRKGLESNNIKLESAEISMIPSNSVKVEGKPAEHMIKMLDLLDDCDDVQKVHSNFDIDDSIIEALI